MPSASTLLGSVGGIAALASLAAPVVAQQQGSPNPSTPALPPALTPEDLASPNLGNSSLFTRWRPRSHFNAPHSWMNDPCGPLYDPNTGLYHLHYQYHPNHVNWGNISWGHAVSRDLFHWSDVGGWEDDAAVSLAPNKYPSAPLSVFTGTTQAVNVHGEVDGTLLTFLTGIHYLPTNWKIPYQEGTEVQAMFSSNDGGETWEEIETVLPSPPQGWNVTGWRDPSFFPSPLLDELTGADEPHFYMVLGSGLKGPDVPAELIGAERPGFLGPRVPLYAAPARNLTDWGFLGALWEPAANSSLGAPDVTGSWGYNFEVSSFFALDVPSTPGEKAWFVGVGAEGGNTTDHWREQWALWNRGAVAPRANGSVEFEPNSGGALDWGIAYAQATWEDGGAPGGPRRVMWGWANEDIEDAYAFDTSKQLGYQGVMTLPTELYVKETEGVLNCGAQQDGSVCVVADARKGATAQTLGIRPVPEVLEQMRVGCEPAALTVGEIGGAHGPARVDAAADVGTSFELTATLKSWDAAGKAGIVLARSPDDAEYTVVWFDAAAHLIGVNREHSSQLPQFRNRTFQGHFEPYLLWDEASGCATPEPLEFHVVLDGSLLEVWVNERFALTAQIYPSREDSTGLSFFAGDWEEESKEEAATAHAVWEDVKVWQGLAQAWPERPEDTSVELVWDSPEETNNYEWWAGYRA